MSFGLAPVRIYKTWHPEVFVSLAAGFACLPRYHPDHGSPDAAPESSLEQPTRSLKGFQRVMLAPGESKTVYFPLRFDELEFFDNEGKEQVEPSDYTVWVGGDSNARSSARFTIQR